MSVPGSVVFFAGFIAIIGIYINWPPPELNENLREWKKKGSMFNFNNEHRIFYIDETGNSADDILVCIHGFPTSSYDWLKIWEPLKQKFNRIIALDLLGFGFSEKPIEKIIFDEKSLQMTKVDHNYTMGEQADIVEALIVHLEIKRVHLLSHDYGDTVVQEILARHNDFALAKKEKPYEIVSVCLLNGGIFPDTHKPRLGQRLFLNPHVDFIISRIMNSWFFGKGLDETFGPNTKPTSQDIQEWWQLLRILDGNMVLGRLLNYIPERRVNQKRWTSALQNTAAELHMIYGPEDPVNPKPEFEIQFRKRLPKATIDVVDGIGHYVQWEDAESVLKYYFRFLNRVKSKDGTKWKVEPQ